MQRPEAHDLENYPVPPDFVFKYKRNRIVPEQQVLEQEQSMFVGAGIVYPSLKHKTDDELVALGVAKENLVEVRKLLDAVTPEEEEMGGQLQRYEKVPYPAKGHPFPPALYAINAAKRNTLNLIRMIANPDMTYALIGFAVTPRKKKISAVSRWLFLYKESMMRFIEPYVLEDEFCTPFTREMRKLIRGFLVSFGIPYFVVEGAVEAFVMDLEYDNAYRWPLQDAFTETTKEKLLANPAGELMRLLKIILARDKRDNQVDGSGGRSHKFDKFEKLLKYIFYVPGVTKAFKAALDGVDFIKLQFDKGDKFFVLLDPSYQFLGKTQEERWKMYVDFYGGEDKLPPRLIWRKQSPEEIAAAQRSIEKILFLDMDGVMNTGDKGGFTVTPELAERYKRIVAATDCSVVLSSTWRNHPQWRDILKAFGIDTSFIVDRTPSNNGLTSRGTEIKEWLEGKPVRVYAILDDGMDFLEGQPLVQTDPTIGLTDELADKVISILGLAPQKTESVE